MKKNFCYPESRFICVFSDLLTRPLFLKGTDNEAKIFDGKVQSVTEKACLFIRKVVVTDNVKLSVKKALLKSCAIYPYIESLNKYFIMQGGQNCFIKECFWNGAHPRLTLSMVRNSLFRSTPFSNQKFGIKRFEIQRGNGVPLAGTSVDTSNNVRLYYSTKTALRYSKSGNGMRLEDLR